MKKTAPVTLQFRENFNWKEIENLRSKSSVWRWFERFPTRSAVHLLHLIFIILVSPKYPEIERLFSHLPPVILSARRKTNVETARDVDFVQGLPRSLLITLSFFNEFHWTWRRSIALWILHLKSFQSNWIWRSTRLQNRLKVAGQEPVWPFVTSFHDSASKIFVQSSLMQKINCRTL